LWLEERFGDAGSLRFEVRCDGLALLLGLGGDRLEARREVVDQAVGRVVDESGLEPLDHLVAGFDRHPAEAALALDLFVDQLGTILDEDLSLGLVR
jgi:hypothetical protein